MNDSQPKNQTNHSQDNWLCFLAWFCPTALYEGIEGDLLEEFERNVENSGEKIARRRLIWGVIRFFRPDIILRNRFSIQLIHTSMIRNYLIVAFRNILKTKVFSGINIFGLGVGLAACLLIVQFVMFELSYDKFHEKFERTFRVANDRFQNGKLIQHGTITYPTIGPTMAKDFPEVEAYTRLMPAGQMNIKAEERFFRGDNCHFADEHFLFVFSFPLLAGDRITALKERYSIVLTETVAKKYFDVKDKNYSGVINKVVYWGLDPQPYKVTAVCKDVPENSHLQFDALVSYQTLISPENHGADDSWTWSDMYHYIVLKPGVDYKILESKFDDFSQRYFKGDKVSGSVEKFFLQPLKEAHLYSNYEYDFAKTSSGKAVWAMLIVAGFILVIAWINYINLTTSRAMERAKEVGLRKVMGAIKSQLVQQFIFESILISLFALVVALAIVQLSQNSFNQIIGGNLSWWKVFSNLDSSILLVLVSILIGGLLLSGFYPAFVLSSYQPITVLKGKFQRSTQGHLLRKGLVVFQFMASAALITGTLIVSRQLNFMNEADLGINIQNIVIVQPPERTPWDSTFIQHMETFKHELSQVKEVIHSTTSNNIPGARLGRTFNVRLADQPSSSNYTMSFMVVDNSYFDTYQVPLAAGRNFQPTDFHFDWKDNSNLVLNENAIRLLGIKNPGDAIGKPVTFWGKTWTIVGVVSDFHQQALKNPMEPMLFFPAYSTEWRISIRIQSDNVKKSLAEIEGIYHKFFAGNPFEYFFLEDDFRKQYRDDTRFEKIVSIFTVLAIIISCMGLIGLSSYTAIQRTKEIGIRKVLGASLVNIVSLLSVDFLKLIVLATILSLPVSYFALKNWLEVYAYRIPLEWMLFGVPILMILLIAAITMSFHVLKTAMTNPADTLKHE